MKPIEQHSCEIWFDRIRLQIANGLIVQTFIKERLAHLPFEVNCHYGTNVIAQWDDTGITMDVWKDRVRQTAAALGRPPKFTKNSAIYGNAPDLRAQWVETYAGRKVSVDVSSFSAKGCMTDPRKTFIAGQHVELHPECVQAVSEFEDELVETLGVTP